MNLDDDDRRRKMLLLNNSSGILIPRAGLAAQFDANVGITSSGGFASQWSDLSGNARHLLQATGANQPIHLLYAGTKYGWLSGGAGNYFSTSDSVANRITSGTLRLEGKVNLTNTATPSQDIISKWSATDKRAWCLRSSVGKLVLAVSDDGTDARAITVQSTVSYTPTSGQDLYGRCDYVIATGTVTFYTSTDGDTWSTLGTPQATGYTAIYGGTGSDVRCGARDTASLTGRIYSAKVYDNGTPVVDFAPSRWSSGTTFTASTGEEWTINSTGSKPAQIVDRPSLLFDGAAHFMKCAAFTLNQPETVYLVAKQVTWALNGTVFDGNTNNSMSLTQTVGTPNLQVNAGSAAATNGNAAIGANKVISTVFNGASSGIIVNATTETTGNVGAGNAGGFTMGKPGVFSGSYANIQAYEALIYNVAHTASERANIIRALMTKHGIT